MTPGKVYRQYSCGHLFSGKPFRMFARVNGKRTTLGVCPKCRTSDARFEYMIRECPECGHIDRSDLGRLHGDLCRLCSKARSKRAVSGKNADPVRFFQAGKRIDKPRHPVTEPLCRHRTACLPDDARAFLHCGGCPHFEREDLEAMVYDRRDHDPYEWSYGEAI